MARINYEDTIDADSRFKRLVKLLGGDEDKAHGMLIRFWRLAQKLWGSEMSLMPMEDFLADGFEPLLKCGLAEARAEGVYAKGSEEQFDWYLQRCRASRSGIAARGAKRVISGPQVPETTFRSTGNDVPVNPLSLSLSPSPSQNTYAGEKSKTLGEELKPAFEEWKTTMLHHGIKRDPHLDEVRVFQLAQRYGLERVVHAIRGMRMEPAGADYDPAANCFIDRLLKPAAFGRLENLGARHVAPAERRVRRAQVP